MNTQYSVSSRDSRTGIYTSHGHYHDRQYAALLVAQLRRRGLFAWIAEVDHTEPAAEPEGAA